MFCVLLVVRVPVKWSFVIWGSAFRVLNLNRVAAVGRGADHLPPRLLRVADGEAVVGAVQPHPLAGLHRAPPARSGGEHQPARPRPPHPPHRHPLLSPLTPPLPQRLRAQYRLQFIPSDNSSQNTGL